jgi:hypothetical protein
MTKVTDFRLVGESGERALCDAFGNNVAFRYSVNGATRRKIYAQHMMD